MRAAAERLGYRPNARVGELMAHIRLARPLAKAEPLAFVYLEGDRAAAAGNGFAQQVERAARRHAERRGYRLDAFWLKGVEGNARRLADILEARGIGGVLFAPTRRTVEVAWPWDRFAMAVVGMSEMGVEVPRAGHHHYEAMRMVLGRLQGGGARRPACLVAASTNERAHRGWQAAWLAFGPRGGARRLRLYDEREAAGMERWLREVSPDAVVSDDPWTLRQAAACLGGLPRERCVLLSWSAGVEFPGIEQGYDEIAEHGVDMLVTQLQRNERGLPNPPPMLLFPGRWREPA